MIDLGQPCERKNGKAELARFTQGIRYEKGLLHENGGPLCWGGEGGDSDVIVDHRACRWTEIRTQLMAAKTRSIKGAIELTCRSR